MSNILNKESQWHASFFVAFENFGRKKQADPTVGS
jgi:hypothetical protein